MLAIVGTFHKHLIEMKDAGVVGDELNNHPVTIAFLSKLKSLSRMTDHRECRALDAVMELNEGKNAEYEVIPLM